MNTRLTLVLAGVLAVVGGYAWWEARQPAPVDYGGHPPVWLWNLSSKQFKALQAIQIDKATASVTYEQTGKVWHASVAPRRDLQPSQWQSTLDGLQKPTADRKVADTIGHLADYGLDKPSLTLRLTLAKQTREIDLGGKTPSGSDYYAMVKGDKALYTVPLYLADTWGRLATQPPLAPLPTPSPSVRPSPPPPRLYWHTKSSH